MKKEHIVLGILCLKLLENFTLIMLYYGEMQSKQGRINKYNELKNILDSLHDSVLKGAK